MIKAVIFDVDGVLLDSLESNTQFFQKLLALFGHRGPSLDEYRSMHNLPMWEVIKKMTGLTEKKDIEPIWRRGHDPIPGTDIKPGIPADAIKVLDELSAKYKLAIVTGRIQGSIFKDDLKALEKYFAFAVGFEDTELHKPFPDPLLAAAKRLGLKPGECVYIGDSDTDVQAAIAAGMKIVGYKSELLEDVDAMTSTFAEIPALVEKL